MPEISVRGGDYAHVSLARAVFTDALKLPLLQLGRSAFWGNVYVWITGLISWGSNGYESSQGANGAGNAGQFQCRARSAVEEFIYDVRSVVDWLALRQESRNSAQVVPRGHYPALNVSAAPNLGLSDRCH